MLLGGGLEMLVCRCLGRVKENNVYTFYRLQAPGGEIRDFTPDQVKAFIRAGKLEVTNLTLTSDNRLLVKEENNTKTIPTPVTKIAQTPNTKIAQTPNTKIAQTPNTNADVESNTQSTELKMGVQTQIPEYRPRIKYVEGKTNLYLTDLGTGETAEVPLSQASKLSDYEFMRRFEGSKSSRHAFIAGIDFILKQINNVETKLNSKVDYIQFEPYARNKEYIPGISYPIPVRFEYGTLYFGIKNFAYLAGDWNNAYVTLKKYKLSFGQMHVRFDASYISSIDSGTIQYFEELMARNKRLTIEDLPKTEKIEGKPYDKALAKLIDKLGIDVDEQKRRVITIVAFLIQDGKPFKALIKNNLSIETIPAGEVANIIKSGKCTNFNSDGSAIEGKRKVSIVDYATFARCDIVDCMTAPSSHCTALLARKLSEWDEIIDISKREVLSKLDYSYGYMMLPKVPTIYTVKDEVMLFTKDGYIVIKCLSGDVITLNGRVVGTDTHKLEELMMRTLSKTAKANLLGINTPGLQNSHNVKMDGIPDSGQSDSGIRVINNADIGVNISYSRKSIGAGTEIVIYRVDPDGTNHLLNKLKERSSAGEQSHYTYMGIGANIKYNEIGLIFEEALSYHYCGSDYYTTFTLIPFEIDRESEIYDKIAKIKHDKE